MWKNVRRHFRTYWKLVYLLEGVWRVLTAAQLLGRGRERVLPCSLEKLEKSDWLTLGKNAPIMRKIWEKTPRSFPVVAFFLLFIKVPRFFETSSVLKNFWLRASILEKKWGDNGRKRFYSKNVGKHGLKRIREGEEGGVRENPVGLSIFGVPMETAEYIWVSIWCMLDWILSQNCRNTLSLLKISHCLALGVCKMRHCCGWRGWNVWKLEPIARINMRKQNVCTRS